MKTPLGTELDIGAGRPHCIRRVPSAPRKGHSTPSFRPMSTVATVAHLSYCWVLVQNNSHPLCWIITSDLLCARLNNTRRVFVAIMTAIKVGWNWCSSWGNMKVLIFNEFGLKMHIRSQYGDFVCVGFHFINGRSHIATAKGTFLCRILSYEVQMVKTGPLIFAQLILLPIPGNLMFCSGLDNAVKYPFPSCRLHAHLTQWFVGSTQLSIPSSISIGW